MKSQNIMLIVILSITAFFCSSGDNKTSVNIDFSKFKLTKSQYSHFSEFGKITRVVKLETTEKSLIANVDKVIIDKKNGDILIGDYDSNQKVLRFNSQGKFITSYGIKGNGPSELLRLMGFGFMDNGDVILLDTFKLIKFSKTGTFLQEARLDCSPKDIEIIHDKIYLSVLGYRKNSKEKKAIQIYDSFLVNIGGIGKYESKLEKYKFVSSNTMTKRGNILYFAERYDFILNIYDSSTQQLSQLKIPNNNKVLDTVWTKTNFNENDRMDIMKRLRRFKSVFPLNNGLFLEEFCWGEKIYNLWRLNIDKKEAIIVSADCFVKYMEQKDQDQLFFSSMPGTTDTELIGVFSDSEEFNKYKANYPILKDVDFQMDDNPILAFFQFNDHI